jgi:hypothetical protein
MIFNDILNRWSAKLAREAKMEKKRLARTFGDTPQQELPLASPQDVKAQLRSRVAMMHGFPQRGQSYEPANQVGPDAGGSNGTSRRSR